MRLLLISIYELGRQPFALASAAAWLRAAGHEVTAMDLTRERISTEIIGDAHLVALHISMHTAMRLSLKVIEKVRLLNANARICCFGLYAPLNEDALRAAGVETILGGEFEQSLVNWAAGDAASGTSMARLKFVVPDRSGLPDLGRYARVVGEGAGTVSGYTEASRGCKHLCRHCPVVPVYNGTFRVVQRDVVMEDVRRQIAAGARHITFGDPDFFNGVGHARRIVQQFHEEFPGVSYDVTIKVEHILKHRDELETLQRTGCLFVTSAVESVDDGILAKFAKGHTRADFEEAVALMRAVGVPLSPTFVTFSPWTTRAGYCELLEAVVELGLVDSVAPIQFAIRLLIPAGSRLLELPEVRELAGAFDAEALAHKWRHPDAEMDRLCADLQKMIAREEKRGASRREIFGFVWEMANRRPLDMALPARATVPYLNEPWYC